MRRILNAIWAFLKSFNVFGWKKEVTAGTPATTTLKKVWPQAMLLIVALGGLFWWQGLPRLQSAAIAKATEGKTEGKAEGKTEGKAEGKTEGKAEGKTEGKAEGKACPACNCTCTPCPACDCGAYPALKQDDKATSVTYQGKADGTMDMACPWCPVGHPVPVLTANGFLLTLSTGNFLCVRPPKVLAAGEVFTGTCTKQ